MSTETHVGYASTDRLQNDIFFSFYTSDETMRWTGYNDAYWWNQVSKSDQFQIKTAKNGTRYRLNPESREVTRLA